MVALDEGRELFFGLVGAVGTDLAEVQNRLAQELRRANYRPINIRLSGLLTACRKYENELPGKGAPEDDRINAFMDAGDDLRTTLERGDAVALLAMSKIRSVRARNKERGDRVAYILNSLKHPDEIKTLRDAYGPAFFVISAYSPYERRAERLARIISKSRKDYASEKYKAAAGKLIERDESEVGNRFGQNVHDTFPLADVFVDATGEDRTKNVHVQLSRLVNIVFGHPYITPTIEEYGMFHAKAAALRSADLSRQVGAVIMTSDGEIVVAGCNEVPKVGGGAVWSGREEDEDKDYRDFKLGYDPSVRMRQENTSEVLAALKKAGWLADEVAKMDPEERVSAAIYGDDNPPLKGTRLAGILEFGRIIHAEMSAITDAARRGLSMKGSTLYCTTFPCHMCARHIIASGIEKVVYIEPYPKSLAKDLYQRMIRVDHDTNADPEAVSFEPFVGCAPLRFLDFFEMTETRKDDYGLTLSWNPSEEVPRITQFPTYLDVETTHVDLLDHHRDELGLSKEEAAGGKEKLA